MPQIYRRPLGQYAIMKSTPLQPVLCLTISYLLFTFKCHVFMKTFYSSDKVSGVAGFQIITTLLGILPSRCAA